MRHLPRLHRPVSRMLLLCILLPLVALPDPVEAAAGINKTIHYQGKVSLTNSAAVSNGSYSMRFKIFDALTSGTQLWAETWNSSTQQVTMTGGLFSVALGTHVTMTGSVNFNQDNLYLQVEFDPGDDGAYEEIFSPRRRFSSVPYAHNADALDGLSSDKFLRRDTNQTLSGSLTIQNAGVGINALGAISGATLFSSLKLATSGSLTVNGAVRFKNYPSCGLIATDASGNLSCGSAGGAFTSRHPHLSRLHCCSTLLERGGDRKMRNFHGGVSRQSSYNHRVAGTTEVPRALLETGLAGGAAGIGDDGERHAEQDHRGTPYLTVASLSPSGAVIVGSRCAPGWSGSLCAISTS